MFSIRCSSLPLWMKCAQSVNTDVAVNEWFPETALGTAAHEAAKRHLRNEEVDTGAIAALLNVDAGDLAFLYAQLCKAWQEVRPRSPDAVVLAEQRMVTAVSPDIELTGTGDAVVIRPGLRGIDVTDWKSGRRDSDYSEQVLGYCMLALDAFPQVERATARVVWLRTLEAEVYSLTRRELETMRERLVKQRADQAFRPGPHCKHCPRRFACAARDDMQQAGLVMLGSARGRNLREMSATEQLSLYHRAKDVVELADKVVAEVRAIVEESGVVQGDGWRLEMVEEQRRQLRPLEAWPILQRQLDDEALAGAVKISLTAVQEAVAKKAPRGQGAATKRALLAELEDAGAVEKTTVRKLTERRG